MTDHFQYVTIRNDRGQEMMDLVKERFVIEPTVTAGDRRSTVIQTVKADDQNKGGNAPKPFPKWIGNILAWILTQAGPKGMEFAKYSIDYHTIRNYVNVHRKWGKERRDEHVPSYSKRIVSEYEAEVAPFLQ